MKLNEMVTIHFSEQLVTAEDHISQDVFLLLDEVPCNSDPGFTHVFYGAPSGDWKDLKTNGVNLMMALKPFENSGGNGLFLYLRDKVVSRKKAIDLRFPNHITNLELSRIYRCTKNIAAFHEKIVSHINKPELVTFGINSSSISYSPGHEIYGDHPEVLLLPRCNCWRYCRNPVEHLLEANKTKILAMLKRMQSKFSVSEITVLIDTSKDEPKCVDWLRTELVKENVTIGNIAFKTIGQCRGLEFPVLLTISTYCTKYGFALTAPASTTLDAWTRVTASLFIIQMDEKYSAVTQGLKHCLKKQVTKKAEEQEKIKYNLLRKLYFFIQRLAFFIIMPLLWAFGFLIQIFIIPQVGVYSPFIEKIYTSFHLSYLVLCPCIFFYNCFSHLIRDHPCIT